MEGIVVLVVLALLFLVVIYLLPGHGCREPAIQVQCAANLAGISRAIAVYQKDFRECNPVVFGPENGGSFGMGLYNKPGKNDYTRWIEPNFADWEQQPTAGGCLFLLVKYCDVSPEVFLCPAAEIAEEMTLDMAKKACLAKGLPGVKSWMEVNDFQSLVHLSYSYNDPWKALLTSAAPAGAAVMADKNPAYTTPTGILNAKAGEGPVPNKNGSWDDDKGRNPRAGNSPNHGYERQNAAFADSHVKRYTMPTAGIEKDNIYTYWPDGEKTTPEQKQWGRWDKNHAAALNDSYLGN